MRDFYKQVVGWDSNDHNMGEYNDYNIHLPGIEETVAGICHSRGPNINIPLQWLTYVPVEYVHVCEKKCISVGWLRFGWAKIKGGSNLCVIKDPVGAVLALLD